MTLRRPRNNNLPPAKRYCNGLTQAGDQCLNSKVQTGPYYCHRHRYSITLLSGAQVTSQYDDWTTRDRNVIISALHDSNRWNSNLTKDQARSLYAHLIISGNSRNILRAQLGSYRVHSAAVQLAINAVSYAITDLQEAGQGFAIFNQDVQGIIPNHYQPLLLRWIWTQRQGDGQAMTSDDSSILIVVQWDVSRGDNQYTATIHALDPGVGWHLDQQQRITEVTNIRAHLSTLYGAGVPNLPNDITWVTATPQTGNPELTHYYTIFQAWSILLGLQLAPNLRNGTDRDPDFRSDANKIVERVLQGNAGWDLIFAFLRSYGFIDPAARPDPNRRFDYATGTSAQDTQYQNLVARISAHSPPGTPVVLDALNNFAMLGLAGQPHQEILTSDSWSHNNRAVHAPALQDLQRRQDAGTLSADEARLFHEGVIFNPRFSAERVQQNYDTIPKHKPTTDGDSPCQEYKRLLGAIEADSRVASWLGNHKQIFGDDDQMLYHTSVHLAISAVLVALNKTQGLETGFSIIESVETEFDNPALGSELVPTPTLRPGRPLICPILLNHHIVLGILCTDDSGQISINVIDSRVWRHDSQARAAMLQRLTHFNTRVGWTRSPLPATINWIRGAPQTNSFECGYITILNGWAHALDLEVVDPDEWQHKTRRPTFHHDIGYLAHIVSGGFADWSLIHAFLRCIGFVTDTREVPANRRFGRTNIEIVTDDDLRNQITALLPTEGAASTSPQTVIRLPVAGTNHTARFPSDRWSANFRDTVILGLERHGIVVDPDRSLRWIERMANQKNLLQEIQGAAAALEAEKRRHRLDKEQRIREGIIVDVTVENLGADSADSPTWPPGGRGE